LARSFRIFRMWGGAIPKVMEDLYGSDPQLAEAPYEHQMRRFFERRSTFSNYFSRCMNDMGHEVMEVVFDHEPAQRAWAREHDVAWNDQTWQSDIPLAQMQLFKPDILNLHSLVNIPRGIGAEAKALCPSIKMVAAFVGSKIYEYQYEGVDFIMTGVLPLVDQFRARGIETHLVYHAFDQSVAGLMEERQTANAIRYPFTFIGTSGFAYHDYFQKRYWLLIELLIRTHLEAWVTDGEQLMPKTHTMNWSVLEGMRARLIGQAEQEQSIEQLQVFMAKIVGSMTASMTRNVIEEYQRFVVPADHKATPLLPVIPLTKVIPEKCHPPVYGLDFYDLLSRSDVSLNVEADINMGATANMRMFEATGMGTCLLTEQTPNIVDLFEPDREVVTYGSTEECIEKSRFLLNNPKVRREIAAAGRARTLRDHTVEQRCVEIDSLFQRFVQ
jgi:spore maturation protein CgeB